MIATQLDGFPSQSGGACSAAARDDADLRKLLISSAGGRPSLVDA
jgi:hypothetical protein